MSQQTSPKLGCDIDGVLYPYIATLCRYAETISGKSLCPHPPFYDLVKSWGITMDEQQQAHLKLFSSAPHHHAGAPLVGAPETLWALAEAGVEITYVSRRATYTDSIGGDFKNAVGMTGEWLHEWMPPGEMVFVDDKREFRGHADLMLEDNPAEAAALREAGRTVWLLKQTYNLEAPGPHYEWGGLELASFLLGERTETDRLVGAGR